MFLLDFAYEIILIVLSIGGILLTRKIIVGKRDFQETGKALVCPLDGHCEKVITSDFSKIMGVPLEIAGALYYVTIILANIIFIIIPQLKFSIIEIILYGATFFGFLFSIYLTAVQGVILKNWCTWCLSSALFSALIFITSTGNMSAHIDQFIFVMKGMPMFFILVHIISYALGTSLALATCILTLRFLKDFQIDRQERIHLTYFWQALWLTIFLIVLSSFAIFVFDLHVLESYSLFKLKSVIFALIIFSSAILSFFILPKLSQNRIEATVMHINTVIWGRNSSIILSTFLLVSWMLNLFIEQVFYHHQSLTKNLLTYFSIAAIVIVATTITFQIIDKKKLDKQK